jgi:hypothetical protein
MQLTYSGPKALISSHGISFDVAKDDKYIYLSMLAELIIALNHEYIEDKRYSYLASNKPLNSDQILSQIRECDPLLDEDITNRKNIAENEIDEELERAHNNHLLNSEEREILIKNISMMRDYNINRAINKAVYYSGLNSLAIIIKKGHINTISAPMIPKFTHVLHSLQGALLKLHPRIESTIDIYEHQGHITVNLSIKFS